MADFTTGKGHKNPYDKEFVMSVLVRNKAGVLLRIAGLFSRRFYNIMSIVAAQTENPDFTQIIIVVQGDDRIASQVVKQLSKLIDIVEVNVLDRAKSLVREHLMIKVAADPAHFGSIVDIANMFKANILDVSENTVIMELTADNHTLDSFVELCKVHGIQKMVRTGCSAMERGAEPECEINT